MKTFPLFFSFCILLTFSAAAEQIEFHPGSFASAKNKASDTGKPLLVAFMASWSSNCRRMRQLVFTNDRLAEYVNPRYVAVQVDVDDFDGLVLKERYRIKELPSFLVFDQNGNFLSRSEGEMDADQMQRWLSDFPQQPTLAAKGPTPDRDKAAQTMSAPRLKAPVKPAPAAAPSPSAPAGGGKLYELNLRPAPAVGFSVQLGVFSTLDNASRAMVDLQEKAGESLAFLLYAREEQGLDRYKVLAGRFPSRSEAQELVNRLARRGVKGFVKPLTDL